MPTPNIAAPVHEMKIATIGTLAIDETAPPATTFAAARVPVAFFQLNVPASRDKGRPGIVEPPHTRANPTGVEVVTDLARLAEFDAIVIPIPAAITPARGADTTAVTAATTTVGQQLRAGQLVILTGAVPPGTTRHVALPALVASGLKPGGDFLLAYSPEPSEEGAARVVGSFDEASARAASSLFARAGFRTTRVSSLEVAEVCGAVGAVVQSLGSAAARELSTACVRMGVDVWEVIEASGVKSLATSRGANDFASLLLAHGLRRWGATFRLAELAAEINASMPSNLAGKITDVLNDAGKAVKGSKVAILGILDRKGADNPRESRLFELMAQLLKKGAQVSYSDPRIPSLTRAGDPLSHLEPMQSHRLTPEYLAAQDCVLITTDHIAFDYGFIVEHSNLVVDTCNATKAVTSNREKIMRV